MQVLSLSRRLIDKFPPEAFTPELLKQETARVRELYAAGTLRQIWKRGDIPGATILWEAASETEVREAIDSLPIFPGRPPRNRRPRPARTLPRLRASLLNIAETRLAQQKCPLFHYSGKGSSSNRVPGLTLKSHQEFGVCSTSKGFSCPTPPI